MKELNYFYATTHCKKSLPLVLKSVPKIELKRRACMPQVKKNNRVSQANKR